MLWPRCIFGLASLLGRVVSGMVADRWGATQTLIAMLSLQAPAILLYLLAGSAASFYALAVAAAAFLFALPPSAPRALAAPVPAAA